MVTLLENNVTLEVGKMKIYYFLKQDGTTLHNHF